MKQFLISAVLFLVSAISITAFAQNKTLIINGRITSFEESLPLEGVSVVVKDSKNNTGTQPDGTFSLEVAAEDKILVISREGYEKKEIKLTGARDYEIVLKRSGAVLFSSGADGYYLPEAAF